MAVDLIEIKDLKTYFYVGKGILSKLFGNGLQVVHAVDGISMAIGRGRTFGLVGESGCGKSTLAQTLFRLVKPKAGEILYQGRNIFKMDKNELSQYHQKAQMVFQDQFGCLNPRMTAGQIIAEPFQVHRKGTNGDGTLGEKVASLLDSVNLSPEAALKFPHEFSGGQARRIGLAKALALNPDFMVADEPTSGLDISTAATVLNLMQDLQENLGLTYLWISHNLNQVKYMSDDIAVMYLGKIVEMGKTKDVLSHLSHPYSKALISAMPRVGESSNVKRIVLKGEIPSPINPPSGCSFRSRCRYAMPLCKDEEPGLTNLGNGHFVACHLMAG